MKIGIANGNEGRLVSPVRQHPSLSSGWRSGPPSRSGLWCGRGSTAMRTRNVYTDERTFALSATGYGAHISASSINRKTVPVAKSKYANYTRSVKGRQQASNLSTKKPCKWTNILMLLFAWSKHCLPLSSMTPSDPECSSKKCSLSLGVSSP